MLRAFASLRLMYSLRAPFESRLVGGEEPARPAARRALSVTLRKTMRATAPILMLMVSTAFAAANGIVADGRVGLPILWQQRNDGTPGEICTFFSKHGSQMLRVSQIWVGPS